MDEHPATRIVHWLSGPIACCEKHERGLLKLAGIMGAHVVSSPASAGAECSNCKNESKSNG